MEPKDYWNTFVPGLSVGEFMCQHTSRSPLRCAERYVAQCGAFYGVMRQGAWKETFRAPVQFTRESVLEGLAAHLEETRAEWEPALVERDRRQVEAAHSAIDEAARRASAPPPILEPAVESAPPLETSAEVPVETSDISESLED